MKKRSLVTVFDTGANIIPNTNGSRKWPMVSQVLREMNRFPIVDSVGANLEDVLRAHDGAYVDAFLNNRLTDQEMRRVGIVWSEHLVQRVSHVVGACVAACDHVMSLRKKNSSSVVVAAASAVTGGGAHHAHRGYGSGYCVWNDVAIGALWILHHHPRVKVLSLDLDVHQGDGTATILRDVPRVYTVSLHAQSNFPFRKAHSHLDVPLPDNTGDDDYLRALHSTLKHVDEHFGHADVCIYQGGVDCLESDRLGRLSLSMDGLKKRDLAVYAYCKERGMSVVSTMGGGYYHDDASLKTVVEAHVQQVTNLAEVFY